MNRLSYQLAENKKKPFFLRKWDKLKRWYHNRMNPNQWVYELLANKRREFIKLCTIKYNYRVADNYSELLQNLTNDIHNQVQCIQFVQSVSQLPQRFSTGSDSSSSSGPELGPELRTIEEPVSSASFTTTPSNKMSGIEIEVEILILEYLVLKEHLANCIQYLQHNKIPIPPNVTTPMFILHNSPIVRAVD